MVRLKKIAEKQVATRTGIVVDTIQKKVWRTDEMGPMIDWRKVDPELHAVVMYDDCKLNIPAVELEVIDERNITWDKIGDPARDIVPERALLFGELAVRLAASQRHRGNDR